MGVFPIADCRLQIADWKTEDPDGFFFQSAICNLQSAIFLGYFGGVWRRSMKSLKGARYSGGGLGLPSVRTSSLPVGRLTALPPMVGRVPLVLGFGSTSGASARAFWRFARSA